jgi:cytosine deaminase
MTGMETLFTNAKLPDGSLSDIGVSGGRIVSIVPSGASSDLPGAVDIAGALLVPAFVEGHIHLDTSFWGDRWIPHKP